MTTTDTYLLLRAFCEELARCGLRHACTSPGSRNTPLILSLVREPRITTYSHIDERCAGFFALGAANASGRPVAVTCTSGTAAANLTPAVIEAHEACVPLVVLTADRPPELREVGAGQTIDQLKLYGDAVKWFFEVGVHEATDESLRWIRTLACRAYATALEGRPGPVHLNFPLREPLVLDAPLRSDGTGRAGDRPYVSVEPPHVRAGGDGPGPHPSGRLVIVAGTGTHDPAGLAAYAAQQRIPVLADPLSGARRGAAAIAHYDLLLREPSFADQHRPDFVLRVGELPTSKPLRAWLATLADVAQIAFDPYATWRDPASATGMRIHTAPPMPDRIDVEPGWLESWSEADVTAAVTIEETLGDALSEPLVARKLAEWLPADATLFVASSMPVRDVEEFAGIRDDPPRVLANRGANGIDGTVSSAFGVAAVSERPVVLLIGDVALAHDIGGLLGARRLELPLTIVLLNNDGGGIFHFLPVATQEDAFEDHIATPTGLDFARAAALYGCDYERPANASELRAALERALAAPATAIIEVATDRDRNLELHRRVAEQAISALR
ncbi:MAG TPA: 2-succinyl-5-enolpyruvyl-6-hydroxy-3-cyclohexene-1-carboxylic-acid synthase [Solirubrobacteraceae bacterium]|nr:2-succinyl-5-enolpyruvyl-6-hydroxy-3-cyclohexene-1-carboxylic-acid synthase [Solirubrobacteraceae bacterium]